MGKRGSIQKLSISYKINKIAGWQCDNEHT